MSKQEFKKGQIVYVSNSKEAWFISHFVKYSETCKCLSSPTLDNSTAISGWDYCLSIEDYQKMKSQPKDKDLVWAWNDECKTVRVVGFYDAINCRLFDLGGSREGAMYDSYEVIPKDQWPDWAHEAYKLLEDSP